MSCYVLSSLVCECVVVSVAVCCCVCVCIPEVEAEAENGITSTFVSTENASETVPVEFSGISSRQVIFPLISSPRFSLSF